MGKIKRPRTKLHLPAEKRPQGSVASFHNPVPDELKAKLPPVWVNPFGGISISSPQLHQSLSQGQHKEPESSIPSSTVRVNDNEDKAVVPVNKKERRKQKRQKFLKKLEVATQDRLKEKAAKKRSSVPVVGDLQPMALALNDISDIVNENKNVISHSNHKTKKRRKPRRLKGITKHHEPLEQFKTINDKRISKVQSRRTQKHMLYEVQRIQKLVSNTSFSTHFSKILSNSKQK